MVFFPDLETMKKEIISYENEQKRKKKQKQMERELKRKKTVPI